MVAQLTARGRASRDPPPCAAVPPAWGSAAGRRGGQRRKASNCPCWVASSWTFPMYPNWTWRLCDPLISWCGSHGGRVATERSGRDVVRF